MWGMFGNKTPRDSLSTAEVGYGFVGVPLLHELIQLLEDAFCSNEISSVVTLQQYGLPSPRDKSPQTSQKRFRGQIRYCFYVYSLYR